jgi:hypothetical protein
MNLFCAHQQNAGTVSDSVILSEKPCCERSPQDVTAVGTGLLDKNIAAVELELDRVIHDLHEQSKRAYERGDPIGARIYLDRADAARRSRSDEHQQRLHAKAWQRMLDEDYFGAMGQRDAAKSQGGGLA